MGSSILILNNIRIQMHFQDQQIADEIDPNWTIQQIRDMLIEHGYLNPREQLLVCLQPKSQDNIVGILTKLDKNISKIYCYKMTKDQYKREIVKFIIRDQNLNQVQVLIQNKSTFKELQVIYKRTADLKGNFQYTIEDGQVSQPIEMDMFISDIAQDHSEVVIKAIPKLCTLLIEERFEQSKKIAKLAEKKVDCEQFKKLTARQFYDKMTPPLKLEPSKTNKIYVYIYRDKTYDEGHKIAPEIGEKVQILIFNRAQQFNIIIKNEINKELLSGKLKKSEIDYKTPEEIYTKLNRSKQIKEIFQHFEAEHNMQIIQSKYIKCTDLDQKNPLIIKVYKQHKKTFETNQISNYKLQTDMQKRNFNFDQEIKGVSSVIGTFKELKARLRGLLAKQDSVETDLQLKAAIVEYIRIAM